MVSKGFLSLEPKYLLNENWGRVRSEATVARLLGDSFNISPQMNQESVAVELTQKWDKLVASKGKGARRLLQKGLQKKRMPISIATQEKEEEVLDWLADVFDARIEIAEMAGQEILKQEGNYEYVKSDLNMNMIVPKGSLKQLRFIVAIQQKASSQKKIYATDGFPNDLIEDKHILAGRIKLNLGKIGELLQFFVPGGGIASTVTEVVGSIIDVDLKPWGFQIGRIRRRHILFSGPNTTKPEWHINRAAIKGSVAVTLVIKKHESIDRVEAKVQAAWGYASSIFRSIKTGWDEKTIIIFDRSAAIGKRVQ